VAPEEQADPDETAISDLSRIINASLSTPRNDIFRLLYNLSVECPLIMVLSISDKKRGKIRDWWRYVGSGDVSP